MERIIAESKLLRCGSVLPIPRAESHHFKSPESWVMLWTLAPPHLPNARERASLVAMNSGIRECRHLTQ